MADNVNDLVGIPFVDRGREISEGLDCWGLVKEASRRMGNELPDFSVSAFASKEIHSNYCQTTDFFEKVDDPQPGDLVAMSTDAENPNCVQHIGVYLGNGRMLHTYQKMGSCVVRTDHPYWKNKIKGYYRWKK